MTNYEEYGLQFDGSSKRKRKKQIINEIKKQLGFYFSDSNLVKDRFLRVLIEKDSQGFVLLDTIEHFGRIADMNCPRSLLIKSIKFIPDLELNADETCVRRTTPINYNYSGDDRTIYIENLPQKMDHKRLEQALSKYGTITHISLPRFKNNKEFKGFGFIEFEKVEEAEKALEGLGWEDEGNKTVKREQKLECKPEKLELTSFEFPCQKSGSSESMNPPTSLSILKSEPVTPSTGTPDVSSASTPDVHSETELSKDGKDDQQKKKRRRRRSSICLSELKTPDCVNNKKRDPLLLVNSSQNTGQPLTNSARKRKRTSLETVSPVNSNKVRRVLNVSSASVGSESDNQKQETSDAELKKQLKIVKAKRRKKKNQKLKKKSELQDIRVFPKLKWMELKVMYKNLQKQQIAEIKHDLGMKSRLSDKQTIRLQGVENESDDVIRGLFTESVVSVIRHSNSVYIRFTTNPDSYKTADLPGHVTLYQITDSERNAISRLLANSAAKRYEEATKKRKLRGYAKVIKKCSAKDQTSQGAS
ncbi:hypothetical protein ACHWQZ_G007455 [Mnemiopsis leidyi]